VGFKELKGGMALCDSHLMERAIIQTMPTQINIKIITAGIIQSGASTHHQFQSMKWVSFKTMNAIVKSPAKPMPPDAESDFLLI
jgi:hypothetical protein